MSGLLLAFSLPAPDSSLCVPSGPAAGAPVRSTRLGWVQGKQATVLGSSVPVNVFLGVPYAAPSVGPLRFAKPKPHCPGRTSEMQHPTLNCKSRFGHMGGLQPGSGDRALRGSKGHAAQ